MAVYRVLTGAEVDAILAAYWPGGAGLAHTLEGISSGSVFTLYKLTVPAGVFSLRVVEDYLGFSYDDLVYESELLAHFAARGFPALPPPIRTAAGERTFPIERGHTLIFPWVEGELRLHPRLTPAHADLAGQMLARLHAATVDFAPRRPDPYALSKVGTRLRKEIVPYARGKIDPRHLQTLIAFADRAGADYPADVSRGTLHGDYFTDNLLWIADPASPLGERISAVIDFGAATWAPLIYDLAVAFVAWAGDYRLRVPFARAILRGYEAVTPLTAADEQWLKEAFVRAAWRFSVTRIGDFELQKAVDKRIEKDYRQVYEVFLEWRDRDPEEFVRLLRA